MSSKKEIRDVVIRLRSKFSQETLEKMSHEVCNFIEDLEIYQKANSIVYYYPKKGEVSLKYLIGKDLLRRKVFLPKTWLKEKRLTFHQIFSFSDLKPGPFGLLEPPKKNPEILPENIELIFVPGLAFDLSKGRIGYGSGFYDRALPRVAGKKVGVAFSFQIFETLPLEIHDCRVDLVITEKGIIR